MDASLCVRKDGEQRRRLFPIALAVGVVLAMLPLAATASEDIKTYADSTYTTLKSVFMQGETVYVKGTGFDPQHGSGAAEGYFYLKFFHGTLVIHTSPWIKATAQEEIFYSYALAMNAPTGTWKIEAYCAAHDAKKAETTFTVTPACIPPTITCPGNITVNTAPGQCGAVVSWTVQSTGYPAPTVVCTPASGSFFPAGTTAVTCTATNPCGTATCSFQVTVVDNQPPVIHGCPGDLTVYTGPGRTTCDQVATWTPPTASDNCGVVSFTSTHNPGATFPVGTTVVTYTARDAANNTTTCSFKVTVVDNTPPVITCPTPAPSYNADPGKCYATLSFAATATDNCGVAGIVYQVNGSPITFPYNFPVGTTTVQVTATDIHGNSATCSFQVTVVDNQPPVIHGCPGDLTVYTGPGRTTCDQVATWTPPTASDNCGVVSFTSTHNPGATFPVGTTVVTYTARDAANNTTTCSFKVTVVDNTPPVALDDSAEVDEGGVVVVDVLANDFDVCGGPVVLVSVTRPRHGQAVIVPGGIEYRPDRLFYGNDAFTYAVRDAKGNLATGTVRVAVRYVNYRPVADAGGPYRGRAGVPVTFDASFSYDPDIDDTLEYRWDVDGDGVFDTEWTSSPRISWTFDRPYWGFVYVEVRDVHRGRPTGATAQASALVLIMPRPTEIAVAVFVDLNEDGMRDEKDVGLPGLTLVLDGKLVAVTDKAGIAVFSDIEPGVHTVAISAESMKLLRDFGLDPGEGTITVEVAAGEWIQLMFTPKRKGFLRVEVEQLSGGGR